MVTDRIVEAALNEWLSFGPLVTPKERLRAALEAAEAAAWEPGTEGAPLDETPILIEVETDWGHRVHRVYWTEAVHGKGIGTWAVDDRKFGPHPLRGYTNIRCWRFLPSPPKDTPHG